ncbi:MAG: flagellar hook-associated protein FlgL [Syntrophales bacterium]|jgi:flagellar hook-associated protein 3 FlgL|nr:flagellar hook-associated protein FlgL [Syntrophales bacterium]
MVMRITENMKFNTTSASLSNVQGQYNSVLEKMASQKRINKISDDPLGMTMLLDYRQSKASLDQYQRNIDASSGWLNVTESKLAGANELLTKASEIAIGQGTATATAQTRRIAAENVRQLKEEMLSLANSQYGNRYIFSGSRMDVAPFSATSGAARVDDPAAASANSFDGTVTKGGAYTGTTNKTYAVKIITGGTLADATYKVSADGGKTWGAAQTDPDTGTVTLGDGVTLTFTDSGAEHLTADDLFSVHAYPEGYYNGNDDNLSVDIGKGATISYNVTGADAFAGSSGGTDILKTLDDLKKALENNDQEGILAQMDKLEDARQQVSLSISKVGATMNRLELADSNLQDFSLKLADLTSKTEDADITELATTLAMKELALQASYATAAKLGQNTILDFIK